MPKKTNFNTSDKMCKNNSVQPYLVQCKPQSKDLINIQIFKKTFFIILL